jgi:predicted metalloprotease with PDZ domain
MKTRFSLVAAVIAVLSFLSVGYASAGAKEKYEAALDSWLGADINDAIRQWGPPSSEYTAPNGERTFSWVRVNGVVVTAEISRQLFGSSVNINSQSRESSCRMSFVVGKPYFGIGATLEEGKEGVLIFSVQGGTPAHQAGLQTGDNVIEINGANVKELLKKGPKRKGNLRFCDRQDEGTLVTFKILRKKEKDPLKLMMVRARMTDRILSHSFQGNACY